MVKYKIIQDYKKCIGCGACVASCNNWILSSDGKAKPKKIEIDEKEYKCNKEAADVCPLKIIKIEKII